MSQGRFISAVTGALSLMALSTAALAQANEETPSAYNSRAQVEQDAYRRQWEAERQASLAPVATEPPTVDAGEPQNLPAAPQDTSPAAGPNEEAALACLNDNRAAVQLPPISLTEYREGRAAGTIAEPSSLCGDSHVPAHVGNASAPAGADQADETMGTIMFFGLIALGLVVYMIPSIIAFSRRHRYRWPLFAFNLGAAWTGIGWIGCLVWAVWPREASLVDPVVGDATGIDPRRS